MTITEEGVKDLTDQELLDLTPNEIQSLYDEDRTAYTVLTERVWRLRLHMAVEVMIDSGKRCDVLNITNSLYELSALTQGNPGNILIQSLTGKTDSELYMMVMSLDPEEVNAQNYSDAAERATGLKMKVMTDEEIAQEFAQGLRLGDDLDAANPVGE